MNSNADRIDIGKAAAWKPRAPRTFHDFVRTHIEYSCLDMSASTSTSFQGVPTILDCLGNFLRILAAACIVNHACPEGTGTHTTGHKV